MMDIKSVIRKWAEDKMLISVIRNASYLFSSQTLSMGLSSLKGILASLLGAVDYGILTIIILFASNVNKLLSFRMGEFVIKYAGQYLASGDKKKAAATIKLAFIAETLTSLVAFFLLALLAPFASRQLLENMDKTIPVWWIIFYGLALLANSITESSTAVLQLSDRYKWIAKINLYQNLITTVWIIVVFLNHGGVFPILAGYWVGKVFNGIGLSLLALRMLPDLIEQKWYQPSIRLLENKKEIFNFSLSTNMSGTLNLLIRDSEGLWVGYLFATTYQAGVYSFAFNIASVVMMPISQFHMVTFPQINQYIHDQAWQPLQNLLKKTTGIALFWIGGCLVGFSIIGHWVLTVYKGGEYIESYYLVLILLVGLGFLNGFFWNRNVLLSFSKQNFTLLTYSIFGFARIILMLIFVPKFGLIMQAILFSLSFILIISLNSLEGLREIKKKERMLEAF